MVQLTVAYFLIQHDGVLGLAYAQIAQSLVILFGSGLLLKRRLPILNIIPRQWSRTLFKEMFRYSASLQAMSICEMIVDPITKVLITQFGGLAMTGYYDLASRMGYQIRALVVIANEVLVPVVATLAETNRDAIRRVYSDAYSLNLFISVPLFSLAVVSMPLISRIWLGSYEATFVEFSSIIAFGWFFNAVSTPAIVVQIGIARLRWVVLASVTVTVLNLLLGTSLGFFYGGGYVIWAWAISRMISGLIVIMPHHLENKIPLRSLIATEHSGLFAGAAVVLYGYTEAYFGNLPLDLQPTELAIIVAGVGLIVVSVPAWFHPVRRRLTAYAASRLLRRQFIQERI
jgi:O-antigen/teichoic acid export membrane protein